MPSTLPDTPVIMAVWHGELGFPPFFYARTLRPNKELSILISEHKDGEYIARTMEYLGLNAVRGSSSRGGARVLLQAMKRIRSGSDIAITPDGPRGPRHVVQDGIIALAQKQNVPIIALSIQAERYWQFSSWDRFMIPKPFSKVIFYASEPFELKDLSMDEAKALVHQRLCRL